MSAPATQAATRIAAADPGAGAGVLAAVAATIIWGGQLPIAKGAFVAVDGYTMTLVRYAAAGIAFLLLLWLREGRGSFSLDGYARPVILGGGLGLGASAVLLFVGLSKARPEIVVILLAMQPALAALGEWIFARRPPPRFTIVCIAFAFAGVALAVTRGGAAFGDTGPRAGEFLGILLTLLAAIAWVGYAMTAARLSRWSALRASAMTSIPALAVIVAAWLVADALGAVRIDAAALPAATWRLAYVALLGVVVGMFLWNAGLQRIGAVNAMLILNLMPVVTFAIRAFEGAQFETTELLGAAIVVAALVANNLMLRGGTARPR